MYQVTKQDVAGTEEVLEAIGVPLPAEITSLIDKIMTSDQDPDLTDIEALAGLINKFGELPEVKAAIASKYSCASGCGSCNRGCGN